jgi:hypothetical protein
MVRRKWAKRERERWRGERKRQRAEQAQSEPHSLYYRGGHATRRVSEEYLHHVFIRSMK